MGLVAIATCVHCGSDGSSNRVGVALEPLTIDDSLRIAAGCSDCVILNRVAFTLPETKTSATSAKLLDSAGHLRQATIRADGVATTESALEALERDARVSKYGVKSDELWAAAKVAGPDTKLHVWFWVGVKIGYPAKETLIADPAATKSFRASVDAAVRAATGPVVAQLKEHGYTITDDGTNTPRVQAWVPAGRIDAELATMPKVVSAGLKTKPRLGATTFAGAVYAPTAHASSLGSGSTVCILEGAYPQDPYSMLSGLSAMANTTPLENSTYHCTQVTGIIRSTTSQDYQMAPSASILICGYEGTIPSPYAHCENWCAGHGANVVNMSSWFEHDSSPGTLDDSDMQFDYLAKLSPYPTMVSIAGNDAPSQSYIGNRGYNEIVVGASDDNGSVPVVNDTIASFSLWKNRATTHGDYELPHVVAPGVNVTGAGITASGTSMAAPVVAGTVALLQARDSAFKSWPEMSRAVILATSVHNVDGLSLDGGLDQLVYYADQKDGVGLLNAKYAVDLAATGNSVGTGNTAVSKGRSARTVYMSGDFDSYGKATYQWNLKADVTGRLRVAVAFDSSATCDSSGTNCTADTLDADLDFIVFKNTGGGGSTPVCSSATYDSSHEVCDFAVTSGETFYAVLYKSSSTASSTYLSIAWYNYDPAND